MNNKYITLCKDYTKELQTSRNLIIMWDREIILDGKNIQGIHQTDFCLNRKAEDPNIHINRVLQI